MPSFLNWVLVVAAGDGLLPDRLRGDEGVGTLEAAAPAGLQ